jgi:hypothetical protein
MPKHLHFFLFSFLFGWSTHIAYAQALACSGYFLRNQSKDTVATSIMVPMKDKRIEFRKLQWRVTVKDPFSTIDLDKMPGDIREFGFSYNGKRYVYWTVPNPFDKTGPGNKTYDKMFLRLIKPGYCKIFAGYTEIPGVNMEGKPSKQDLLLKANNKEWLVIKAGNAKEDLLFYFADFPSLVEKIKNNIYTEKDIEKVVSEYNQFKKNNLK